ncbi:Binding-protein-dependent transport systems inner membrane component [Thermobacillus xylanilyticus]|uniref:Binding-protein-dependent transport systems inner membrane component n=1 Tax=Thermobacillus xylanilyticus TaxID=76633 RepID=A0ABM8V2D0_THEXY|nr:ABC transporter permease [Thermobacillus xylanilyticus]CAG5082774.1 Binding-protein-dependent transport systems inner membrane component [Thermobacillus xylanilyticus]
MNAGGKWLSGSVKALYHGAVWLAFLFVTAPGLLMIIVAFNDADYFSFPLKGVSLRWFVEMAENGNYRGSVVSSLRLALYATALSVLLTLPASLWLHRRANRFVETVLLAPLFFPLVIWSLGLLQLYGMFGLSGRFVTLVLAHTVMVTPFILRVVLQSLREMNSRLEEAAYSLGAGKWSTFRRVIFPIILPGVMVGAVFGYLISFTDVTLTMFISSSGNTTFPVRVYSEQRSEGLNMVVLAWSAVITFVIFIISLIGEKFARWSRYF